MSQRIDESKKIVDKQHDDVHKSACDEKQTLISSNVSGGGYQATVDNTVQTSNKLTLIKIMQTKGLANWIVSFMKDPNDNPEKERLDYLSLKTTARCFASRPIPTPCYASYYGGACFNQARKPVDCCNKLDKPLCNITTKYGNKSKCCQPCAVVCCFGIVSTYKITQLVYSCVAAPFVCCAGLRGALKDGSLLFRPRLLPELATLPPKVARGFTESYKSTQEDDSHHENLIHFSKPIIN